MTAKAVRDLLRAAGGTYLELPIALGVYAGLSLTDIRGLRWSEVDLKADLIERSRSKTGAPIRMPVAPTLRDTLLRYRALRGRVCRDLPTKESMGRALRRLFDQVGVRQGRGTWHRLRHTLGDLMAEQGADLATVGRGLAHKPGSTVTLRYQHSSVDRLRDAVEAIDRRIEDAG